MDEVFKALADASRRRLLDGLNARDGQTLRELCAGLDMTRQSVSKHLAVLEAANLVTTVWRGREKLHYLNAVPINAIADRWISQYDRERVRALDDLKAALEQEPMNDTPSFVYTTYIKTTPERLWQALTDPAFTRRYWGVTLTSDWKPGSAMTWEQFGVTVSDPEQVVLESEPGRRLAYTWHTFTPEFATACGLSDELTARVSAEPRSKVTFEIEPVDDMVRLTVVHDGFPPQSAVREGVSQGWPAIVAGLKTLLETGEALTEPQ
ncbi:ArsR/SmtB family transcription factor [Streptomyces formicae]|uniref:SRPBCC domain-containing protein n=1 Tax=Streptomyces formicae TaxID=1616117 RepID=A0ABY3WPN5_9ACTN|nr:SRPBCC domain-containing protein [Streptomyces formicae]UNM14065.1 SRPBCC domain-containing protein [Streptomyces formicae]